MVRGGEVLPPGIKRGNIEWEVLPPVLKGWYDWLEGKGIVKIKSSD